MGDSVNKANIRFPGMPNVGALTMFAVVIAAGTIHLAGCKPVENVANSEPAAPIAATTDATNTTSSQSDCVYLDGRDFTESNLDPAGVRVYLFVAAKCPISNRYVPEMKRIRELCVAKGHDFFVLYPDPDAALESLVQHADDYGLSGFALWDRHHTIADRWKANYTPEAVVIAGGKVVYRGRIDDWYVSFGKAKSAAETHDLRDVIESLDDVADLPFRETKVIGCPIPRLKKAESSSSSHDPQAGAS